MMRKEIGKLVDDLDGTRSEDISTMTFALDGIAYEINLTAANANNLRKALEDYVAHGRRIGGHTKLDISARRSS